MCCIKYIHVSLNLKLAGQPLSMLAMTMMAHVSLCQCGHLRVTLLLTRTRQISVKCFAPVKNQLQNENLMTDHFPEWNHSKVSLRVPITHLLNFMMTAARGGCYNHVVIIIGVICSVKASCEARKWPMRLLFLAPFFFFHACVREWQRGKERWRERDCLCIHGSIPGLKLVPARSPNGSIDHCSVPFSNQRTAVVVCATQEITHFNCNYIFTAEAKVEREGGGRGCKQIMVDCWRCVCSVCLRTWSESATLYT